jgi:type I restriction enzyme R subunit
MPSQTNEAAFEASIKKRLTCTCLEELRQQGNSGDVADRIELYRAGNGHFIGNPSDFSAKYALDEARFWHFLESTQAEELAKLQKQWDWKLKEYKATLINRAVTGR